MSRAFVKESDDLPELPDRPVSPHPNFVTERGLQLIEAAIDEHRRALAEAQESGDREKIAAASRELRYWNARRASAEVQPPPADCSSVRFGCRVTILRDDPASLKLRRARRTASPEPRRKVVYRIVGEDEADAKAGLISYVSPLARTLIGKEPGDVASLGDGEIEVVAIGV